MKHHFLKLNLDKADVMEVSVNSFSILLDKDTKLNFDAITQVKNLDFIYN